MPRGKEQWHPTVWTHPGLRGLRLPPLLALSVLLLACRGAGSPQGGAITVEDAGGRALSLDSPPSRIVSLVPSMTELVVELGGADRIVGRTRYDLHPDIQEAPALGGGLDPNLETLLDLSPDLVLATPTEDLRPTVERLEALGVPVYLGRTVTLSDLRRVALDLGTLLGGESRRGAVAFVDSLDVGLDALRTRNEGRNPPTVFYLVWNDPPMTVGPGSYLHDLLLAAGGDNVFGDAPNPWPQVNLEEILHRDPDWIVLPGASGEDTAPLDWIRSAPGWRELRAVQEGQVIVVEANLFNRPGPHVLQAARTLARGIHP